MSNQNAPEFRYLDYMETRLLPERKEMMRAFMSRDGEYDGIFTVGVTTTGIFCRPTCPARKPKPDHVLFFTGVKSALDHGFRPCKRCRPMETGRDVPPWLQPLVEKVEAEPDRRWKDQDIRAMGLAPERVRRWFQARHGITFHTFSRARRLGTALGHMKNGHTVTEAAFDTGFDSLSGFSDALRTWIGESPAAARDAPVVYLVRIETPVGPMLVGATDSGVCLLEFTDRRMLETQMKRIRRAFQCAFLPTANHWTRQLEVQLREWFEGSRQQFDLPLELAGTPFQESVWRALLDIPYGQTASYADVARAIGNPGAVRAVARANGDNRIAIIVPCHRVIGSDGSLTGYGGGLWRKKRLLEVESGSREPDLFE